MTNKKIIKGFHFESYTKESFSANEMVDKSADFYEWMDKRRTCRDFSNKPVPKEVIDNILPAASTAPSVARKQPWTFFVVSDATIKKQIRHAAEVEEKKSYLGRMS